MEHAPSIHGGMPLSSELVTSDHSSLTPPLAYVSYGGAVASSTGPVLRRSEALVESTDLRSIEVSVVAVLGLYFLADGLAELCRVSLGLGLHYPTGGPPSLFLSVDIAFIMEALVKVIIGISLVLGRGWTVAVLRGARVWVRKMRTWPD
jgi:hypothetical protein